MFQPRAFLFIAALLLLVQSPAFAQETEGGEAPVTGPAPAQGSAPAQGPQLGICARYFQRAMGWIMYRTPNGSVLNIRAEGGSRLILHVSRRIANGAFGEILELADTDGLDLPELPPGWKWTAKIPLRLRLELGGGAFWHARLVQRRDIVIEELIQSNWSAVESSSKFPSSPHWRTGVMPSVPILHKVKTQYGWVLFKPLLTGHKSMADLAAFYPGGIPEPIVQSVRNIFRMTQAVYDKVRGPGFSVMDHLGIGTHPVSLDINLGNLAYIDDPKIYPHYGLTRPGVVLFEWSEHPGDRFIEHNRSEEEFLKYIFGTAYRPQGAAL